MTTHRTIEIVFNDERPTLHLADTESDYWEWTDGASMVRFRLLGYVDGSTLEEIGLPISAISGIHAKYPDREA